ncbi:MAG: prephenate dehydrogenase [Nitrospiria bacterium]
MKVHFQKVTIIGVGLIGGSLALAIKKRGLAGAVLGIGQETDQLEKAVTRGAIDTYTCEVSEGVEGADLVVLATPVGMFEPILRQVDSKLPPGCIVTDVGSTKGRLVSQIEQMLPKTVFYVGGHPIAGKEKSGIESASMDLFRGARCILTPTPHTDAQALEKVKRLWREVGSEVVTMEPIDHDRVFAAISHLPHMAAYALVNTAMDLLNQDKDLLSFSAGGFKDFTRIAASSPEMWRDICLFNGENILTTIEAYEAVLKRIKEYIRNHNGRGLYLEFERAKKLREGMS